MSKIKASQNTNRAENYNSPNDTQRKDRTRLANCRKSVLLRSTDPEKADLEMLVHEYAYSKKAIVKK